jgi:hypothetical protein
VGGGIAGGVHVYTGGRNSSRPGGGRRGCSGPWRNRAHGLAPGAAGVDYRGRRITDEHPQTSPLNPPNQNRKCGEASLGDIRREVVEDLRSDMGEERERQREAQRTFYRRVRGEGPDAEGMSYRD